MLKPTAQPLQQTGAHGVVCAETVKRPAGGEGGSGRFHPSWTFFDSSKMKVATDAILAEPYPASSIQIKENICICLKTDILITACYAIIGQKPTNFRRSVKYTVPKVKRKRKTSKD